MDLTKEKHKQLELKKFLLISLIWIYWCIPSTANANDTFKISVNDSYILSMNSSTSAMAIGNGRQCKINNLTAEIGVDPRMPPRVSNDGEYIILTEHDYIEKEGLLACNTEIKARSVKNFLLDINKSTGIILGVDIFTNSPDGYLAEIHDMKNIKINITASMFYSNKTPLSKQLMNVFTLASSGIISKDGRYISISNEPDCTGDSYPSVYDLKKKRVVTASAFKGTQGNNLAQACKLLFQ